MQSSCKTAGDIEDYLYQAAELISIENEYYSVGFALHQPAGDIERIHSDNIRNLHQASYQLLLSWKQRENISSIDGAEQGLEMAFEKASIPRAFADFKLRYSQLVAAW